MSPELTILCIQEALSGLIQLVALRSMLAGLCHATQHNKPYIQSCCTLV